MGYLPFRQFALAVGATLLAPGLLLAQVQDPTGIKRSFLDRYLDCAEAQGDVARLACYDALLLDIPTWLEDPHDPCVEDRPAPIKNATPDPIPKIQCRGD